jgi:hypothetical protein
MKPSLAALALILAIVLTASAAHAAPDLFSKIGANKFSDKIKIIDSLESQEESAQDSIYPPVQVKMPSDEVIDSMGNEFQRSSDCAALLRDFADFLANAPSDASRRVSFTAISNRYDGLATYASGWLYYDDYSDALTGEGYQHFNRFTDYPYPAPPNCPFGPQTNNVLGISIDVNNGIAQMTQRVMNNQDNKAAPIESEALEENSWIVALQCENGVLYGFTDASPPEMFVISLKKIDG